MSKVQMLRVVTAVALVAAVYAEEVGCPGTFEGHTAVASRSQGRCTAWLMRSTSTAV